MECPRRFCLSFTGRTINSGLSQIFNLVTTADFTAKLLRNLAQVAALRGYPGDRRVLLPQPQRGTAPTLHFNRIINPEPFLF